MPFPLARIPYGDRCRLRELLSPGEAYSLQLAAPEFAGLLSIQKCVKTSYAKFVVEDSSVLSYKHESVDSWVDIEIPQENRPYYRIANQVEFHNFTATTSLQFLLDFELNVEAVLIADSQVSAEFLRTIGTNIKENYDSPRTRDGLWFLQFNNCTFDDDILPNLFTDVFKNPRRLTFTNVCPFKDNWPASFNGTNIKRMIFQSADAIINVNKGDLIKFMLAQHKTFHMYFEFPEIHEIKAQIDQIFSEPFVNFKTPGQTKRYVMFCNGNPAQSYYYYL